MASEKPICRTIKRTMDQNKAPMLATQVPTKIRNCRNNETVLKIRKVRTMRTSLMTRMGVAFCCWSPRNAGKARSSKRLTATSNASNMLRYIQPSMRS
eukprot:Skav215350  [mRNA]  locus=scaffold1391:414764:419760:+ [translate_table: standard]